MGKKGKGTANTAIRVRVSREIKERIKSMAENCGISMSAFLIESAVKGEVKNRHSSRAGFTAVIHVSKEMNWIGNNINQITGALHQLKLDGKIEAGEYTRIFDLIDEYSASRDQLKDLLLSVQFA